MSQTTLGRADASVGATSATGWMESLLRPLLMIGGVAAITLGGTYLWLQAGGSFSTDDAYVRAAKLAVATDVSGMVQTINVHEGDFVHRGQVLLQLDPAPFRFAVDGARAAMIQEGLTAEAAKRDYQRMLHETAARQAQVQADQADLARFSGLIGAGGVTRADYDRARFKLTMDQETLASLTQQSQVQLARLGDNANVAIETTTLYREAKAKLDEAIRQLAHTTVTAPFDGVVTSVDSIQPGQYLAAATPALGLVSTTDIWVEAFPKETQLTDAVPGDAAVVTVDTYPGRHWDGVLESLSPASGSAFSVLPAQNASGNWVKVVQRIPIRVRLKIAPGDPVLRDGMSVDVEIRTGHKRTLADLF